ncbi:RagB/SusD family nutrient uptake outer membrane protein [Alistipes communis]
MPRGPGARAAADDRYLAQMRVFNPNRDYLWPIPVGEMNTNTAMEQNPGY